MPPRVPKGSSSTRESCGSCIGRLVNVHHHRNLRIAHGQAADLGRGIEIALHGGRRDVQQVGDVVEAAGGVVGRQQQRKIHLLGQIVQSQKIADRVAIFGAGQAMQIGQLARIGMGRGRAVELGFQIRAELRVGGIIRPRDCPLAAWSSREVA